MKPAVFVLVPVSVAYLTFLTGVIVSETSLRPRCTTIGRGRSAETSMILTAWFHVVMGVPARETILSPGSSPALIAGEFGVAQSARLASGAVAGTTHLLELTVVVV